MKSLAVIGSGIAGMACAYFLREHFDVQVFEQDDYIGGHTHTVSIPEVEGTVHVDTGFMVYNEVTYPNLTRLLKLLAVRTEPTSMSFSVQHKPSGLEYAGTGLNGLFAQRRQLLSLAHYRLLFEINRFNSTCTEILEQPRLQSLTLAQYLRERDYSSTFAERYLVPMSSAVWSTPPNRMLEFPAATLVRFFKNHGFLGLYGQHPWRTISGGSRCYRDKIVAALPAGAFKTSRAIQSVEQRAGRVLLKDRSGHAQEFDRVIVATHADQALALLAAPSALEQELLSPFEYQRNVATLHTDETVMPKKRAAWCSWNYRLDKDANGTSAASTIYWMNRLQNVSPLRNYFVSINDPGVVPESKVIRQIKYTHPLFSSASVVAQERLAQLNQQGPISYCGSYFKYGFHEDALSSALQACAVLKGGDAWA